MKVFKLQNAIKPYDWGSPFFIPELLGLENSEGGPWAELWMGVHPGGPSMVRREGEAPLALSRLIEEDPPLYLGPELAESRGGLPFLFKFLAAARPLSIQAHPSLNHAREGFERENRAGLPLAAPHRNYKDPNHKPELVCAISPFTALAGFREAGALGEFLAELFRESPGVYGEAPGLFADALARDGGEPERLRAFLEALFTLSPETLGLLGARLRETGKRRDRAEWKLAGALAEAHPRDPGMLAPFYLNLISLSPGEALYLPPGILHAYIEGFALELMANSDNVLRGGLSSKYIDIPELVRVLDFSPYKPKILGPPEGDPGFFTYPVPGGEFSLSVVNGGGKEIPWSSAGPAVIALTRGGLGIRAAGGSGEALVLKRGESAFAAPGEGLVFSGLGGNPYRLFIAEAPARGEAGR